MKFLLNLAMFYLSGHKFWIDLQNQTNLFNFKPVLRYYGKWQILANFKLSCEYISSKRSHSNNSFRNYYLRKGRAPLPQRSSIVLAARMRQNSTNISRPYLKLTIDSTHYPVSNLYLYLKLTSVSSHSHDSECDTFWMRLSHWRFLKCSAF